MAAPKSASSGIEIALTSALVYDDAVRLGLSVRSDLPDNVVVVPNRMCLVLADGRVFCDSQNAASVPIPLPHRRQSRKIILRFGPFLPSDQVASQPGFYLRFDHAFVIPRQQVEVSVDPMPIGFPRTGPEGESLEQARAVHRQSVATPFPPALSTMPGPEKAPPDRDPVPPAATDDETSHTETTLCAIIPFRVPNTPGWIAETVEQTLRRQIRAHGLTLVKPGTVATRLVREQQDWASGCESVECITYVGELLSVDRLFTGRVDRLGDALVLTIRLVDVPSRRVRARASRVVAINQPSVERAIPDLLGQLLARNTDP